MPYRHPKAQYAVGNQSEILIDHVAMKNHTLKEHDSDNPNDDVDADEPFDRSCERHRLIAVPVHLASFSLNSTSTPPALAGWTKATKQL
jgi:hypothetical protein